MIQLFPYQEGAVGHAVDMLTERGNSLIVAGTGAGKTIMMAAAIGRYFNGFRATHRRNPHVLVLVHRTEIHSQNHSKFSLVCPNIATSEITAERKSVRGYVHFGMVQTVLNLLPELGEAKSYFDMIVIDEAHHSAASTYKKIIEWNQQGNPEAVLLGVTATPNRGDKIPLIDLFDNYYQITSKFLIDSHYLVRPKFIDRTPAFMDKDGMEYGHLQKNIKNDKNGVDLLNQLIDEYLAKKEDGKSIVFAPSHEFCVRIYNRLKELGRKPAYLSPGIDDVSRKQELERFEKGESEELINVDICTEGYDYPPLRNLVEFDTNGTHGQWVQKVGRVLRTTPGKTSCTVIDFGGNINLYPDGVETDVLLEGAVKKTKGQRLSEDDFYQLRIEKTDTSEMVEQSEETFTPYHLPVGFESVNDRDYGIVFVACGNGSDCIILEGDDGYITYYGNKREITRAHEGSFQECIQLAMDLIGEISVSDRPISNLQIKMLAPEYPTNTLTWDGANCCLCWKTWKSTIAGDIQ